MSFLAPLLPILFSLSLLLSVLPTLTRASILPSFLLCFSSLSTFSPRNTATQPYKRGLPYNNVTNIQTGFHNSGSQVSWAYNWASTMNSGFPSYFEFVPMLFDGKVGSLNTWDTNLKAAMKQGSKHVLAFNEPDACGWGQTCLDAKTAADLYKKYIHPYAGLVKLGGPAVTNGPTSKPWLQAFITACSGCHIDFIPLHWYDTAENEGYLYWYVAQMYAAGGNRALWITEFAGSGNQSQQIKFLQTVIPWLDNSTMVERYAWQMAGNGSLVDVVDGKGKPSQLGKVFAYTGY